MAVLVKNITTGFVGEIWGHAADTDGFDTDTVHVGFTGPSSVIRGLFYIPLSPINAVVTEAVLNLPINPSERPEPEALLTMQLTDKPWRWRLPQSGSDPVRTGATWNEYGPDEDLEWETPGGDVVSTPVVSFTPLSEATEVDVDVTSLVSAAKTLGRNDLSVLVKLQTESGSNDSVAFTHYNGSPPPTLTLSYAIPKEPVVDVIARGLVALLQEATIRNGYPFDVSGVYRNRQIEGRMEVAEDKALTLFQGSKNEPEEPGQENPAGDRVVWEQLFTVACCRRMSNSATGAKDTLRAEIEACVEQAIEADHQLNLIHVYPARIQHVRVTGSVPNDPSDSACIIQEVSIAVTYDQPRGNPWVEEVTA